MNPLNPVAMINFFGSPQQNDTTEDNNESFNEERKINGVANHYATEIANAVGDTQHSQS